MSYSYSQGTAVALKNGFHGAIKYKGKMRGRKGIWYGIKLTSPNGNTDGMDNGRYYFVCKEKYGIFVKKKQIKHSLSSTRALLQSQKIEKLKRQNVSVFISTTHLSQIDDINDNKDDEKDTTNNTNNYEDTITHIFLQRCLQFLLPYLNNKTLNNLLKVEHFTTFYDMKLYFNSNILIERILNNSSLKPQHNNSIYKQLQQLGINIQIWNIQKAIENMKQIDGELNNENKRKYKRNKKYVFLAFIALQHMMYNHNKYQWSTNNYNNNNGNNVSEITKANCNKLKTKFCDDYKYSNHGKISGVVEMDSNHLVKISHYHIPKKKKRQNNNYYWDGNGISYDGTARKYKKFDMIFNDSIHMNINCIGMFKGRSNRKDVINKLKQMLIINVAELFVKQWIVLNVNSEHWWQQRYMTTIVGWISPQCCIVVYGGKGRH